MDTDMDMDIDTDMAMNMDSDMNRHGHGQLWRTFYKKSKSIEIVKILSMKINHSFIKTDYKDLFLSIDAIFKYKYNSSIKKAFENWK